MRKMTPFLLIIGLLITLVACQKEESIDTLGIGGSGSGNAAGKSEKGEWNFIGFQNSTLQTTEYSLLGDVFSTLSHIDYTSQNNTGTIKFDGSNMTATGMGYSFSGLSKTYLYINNVAEDSIEIPLTGSVPTTGSTATYKKIGSDSIYVESGLFTGLDPQGGTTQSMPGGFKLKFDADKMYLTGTVEQSKLQVVSGISMKITNKITMIITLQKK